MGAGGAVRARKRLGESGGRGQWTEWHWIDFGEVQFWVASRHIDKLKAVAALVTPKAMGGGAVCRLMHSNIGEDGKWQLNTPALQLVKRFDKLPQAFAESPKAVERKIGLD